MSDLIRKFRERYGFLIGSIVTIVSLSLAIYQFIHIKRPYITLEIVNETDILDVHKPLKDLSVLFQGKDIQASNLNLRILTIRLINSGDLDILPNFYDQEDIWGIEIENGKIVEVKLADSNDDYLRSKLSPELFEPSKVRFKKIIFEKDKYFSLDILVLHSKGQPPGIHVIGKIAGIDTINPAPTWREKQKKTFWKELLEGSVLVHAVRFFLYFVAFFVTVGLGIILPTEAVNSWRRKRRDRSLRQKLEPLLRTSPAEGTKKKLAIDMYLQAPEEMEELAKSLSEDQPKIIRMLKTFNLTEEINRLKVDAMKNAYGDDNWREVGVDERNERFIIGRFVSPLLSELVKKGALRLTEDDKIAVDREFKQCLDELRLLLSKSNQSK